MRLVILIASLSLFLTSCEVMIGAALGGAAGYYAGKEGYKVKIEKEKNGEKEEKK
ncbi:hypothetical protein JCM9492_07740 [Aquifex pyrophilus]